MEKRSLVPFVPKMVELMDPANPPRLDRDVREGTLSEQTLRKMLQDAPDVALGLILLWHDHWDASHEIAQSDEGDPDHDFLHTMIHRRECDFSNAAFWLRESALHPCHDLVATKASSLLAPGTMRDAILPHDRWSAKGFLTAVKNAVRGAKDPENEKLLRNLQAAEMLTFSEWLTR